MHVSLKKATLNGSRILHQYSLIEVNLRENISLEILCSLYPGGSITGAPKVKVIDLLNKLSVITRGVLLWFNNNFA